LFQEAKLSNAIGVAGIHTSQAIAISLIKLGVKDQIYFDELASYARRAIADDPPDPYSVYHVEGNERPEQTIEFNRWCANHGYRLDNCVGMWTTSYVMQLGWLGAAHDQRSIPIFRGGLNGSGSAIVEQCVGGLADLNDKGSIPLIARACARFSKDAVVGIVISAMGYNEPGVLALFAFVQDPSLRESLKKEW
jgi:hypothetical protein